MDTGASSMDLVRRLHEVDGYATKITNREVVSPRRSHKMCKLSRRKIKKMSIIGKQFMGKVKKATSDLNWLLWRGPSGTFEVRRFGHYQHHGPVRFRMQV